MNEHEGHDHDCDPEPECACGEVVHNRDAHRCRPGRRPDGAVYVDSGEGGELYIPLRRDQIRAHPLDLTDAELDDWTRELRGDRPCP